MVDNKLMPPLESALLFSPVGQRLIWQFFGHLHIGLEYVGQPLPCFRQHGFCLDLILDVTAKQVIQDAVLDCMPRIQGKHYFGKLCARKEIQLCREQLGLVFAIHLGDMRVGGECDSKLPGIQGFLRWLLPDFE